MTTLNETLEVLNSMEAQNQFVEVNEQIQRGADPLRKQNEAVGKYTEKRTFSVSSVVLDESEIQEQPVVAAPDIDNIKKLLAEGWVVKDMSFRLEKPNLTS